MFLLIVPSQVEIGDAHECPFLALCFAKEGVYNLLLLIADSFTFPFHPMAPVTKDRASAEIRKFFEFEDINTAAEPHFVIPARGDQDKRRVKVWATVSSDDDVYVHVDKHNMLIEKITDVPIFLAEKLKLPWCLLELGLQQSSVELITRYAGQTHIDELNEHFVEAKALTRSSNDFSFFQPCLFRKPPGDAAAAGVPPTPFAAIVKNPAPVDGKTVLVCVAPPEEYQRHALKQFNPDTRRRQWQCIPVEPADTARTVQIFRCLSPITTTLEFLEALCRSGRSSITFCVGEEPHATSVHVLTDAIGSLTKRPFWPTGRFELARAAQTLTYDESVTNLIGGESGVGKTFFAFTAASATKIDLFFYFKLTSEEAESIAASASSEHRQTAFLAVLKAKFNGALAKAAGDDLAAITYALKHSLSLNVAICLDEAGNLPQATRAMCAAPPEDLRDACGFGASVSVFKLVVGTGVGDEDNVGGSEGTAFTTTRLDRAHALDIYTNLRNTAEAQVQSMPGAFNVPKKHGDLPENPVHCSSSFDALKQSCTAVLECWAATLGPTSTPASHTALHSALRKREDCLRALRAKLLTSDVDTIAPATRARFTLHAILATIERDLFRASAVLNARMASYVLRFCIQFTEHACQSRLLVTDVTPADIDHAVLQPAANAFRMRNGLRDAKGSQRLQKILINALRCAVFDDLADHAVTRKLICNFGVLVDNARVKDRAQCKADGDVELRELRSAEKDADTVVLCLPANASRYTVSPAAVLILYMLLNTHRALGGITGEAFENAVAFMLFTAAQIFNGRPVADLLAFIRTSGGGMIASAFDAEFSDLAEATIVSFADIEVLQAQSREVSSILCSKDIDRTAYVVISAPGFAGPDVVLYLPGGLILAVQCKDNRDTTALDAATAEEEMAKMLFPRAEAAATEAGTPRADLLAHAPPLLVGLLVASSAGTLPNNVQAIISDYARKHARRAVPQATLQGALAIDGYAGDAIPAGAAHRHWAALRRSILPFGCRRPASAATFTRIAAARGRPLAQALLEGAVGRKRGRPQM
jgi:hypothetical protein